MEAFNDIACGVTHLPDELGNVGLGPAYTLKCKFTPPFILDPISRVVRNCYKQTWSSLLTCALYPTLLFNSLKCASKVAVFNTDKTLHKVLYIFGDLCSFDVLVDVDVAQMEDMV